MLKKKLTIAIAPPHRTALLDETSTPVLPRPATCGLAEWLPIAHTTADSARPADRRDHAER